MFLNISKAFDQIWHDDLLYKLKLLGISGRYYNLNLPFLNNRYQKAVSNGQSSKWSLIEAGVPQGSIYGPLFFLFYIINDLSQGLHFNYLLRTFHFSLLSLALSLSNLNEELLKITQCENVN